VPGTGEKDEKSRQGRLNWSSHKVDRAETLLSGNRSFSGFQTKDSGDW
jgi:hypothetical protein